MRGWSVAVGATSLLALGACKRQDQQQGLSGDLARDLAVASSSDGLAMAPTTGGQTVVSARELSPQARLHAAPSARAHRAAPHRAPHQDRVTPQHSEVASAAAAPTPESQPAPAPSEPQPTAPAPEPETSAPSTRPHPVDVGTGAGTVAQGGGSAGRQGGGIGIGDIIGAIGGVIIRGGVVDGDHCDPRADRRRRGGGILINTRGPILRDYWARGAPAQPDGAARGRAPHNSPAL